MTEEIAATPGWVDQRIEEAFAPLPQSDGLRAAQGAYADCLAGAKQPGAPSDMLGAEFNRCRRELMAALGGLGVEDAGLVARLEALEAEAAADS